LSELAVDICVLGAGPAGYVAAIRAAQLGAGVALIEKGELGGTCLNRGCIPTKTLLKTAAVYEEIAHAGHFGIRLCKDAASVDSAAVLERKDTVVRFLRSGIEQLMKKNGVTVCKGVGRIQSSRCVQVETAKGGLTVRCNKLILAAGSAPLVPPIPGADADGVLTSDDALQTAEVPGSIVIVGGGVIGLEFASYYSALGSVVTVVEMKDRILPGEDAEISQALTRLMKKRGVKFKLGVKVLRIDREKGGLNTQIEEKGVCSSFSSDRVLIAVGRKLCGLTPDAVNLGLKENRGAIVVDEHMRTSVGGVYAAGDATGGRLLAHLSFAQGRIAAENAAGLNTSAASLVVPACVYTEPEAASVGLNEETAKQAGFDCMVGRFDFRANGRSLSLGNRDGFVKVIADKSSGVLLGACIFGPDASEMISELTLAVTLKANITVLSDMIHPHPSLAEAVSEACADALGRAIHK